jgi:hypothetical protein
MTRPASAQSRATPEDVRAQLDRILVSSIFTSSQRLSSFLRFLVERSIADRGDEIKEYFLGVEVFGRDAGVECACKPSSCGVSSLSITVPKGGTTRL